MPASITITLSEEVLDILLSNRSITVALESRGTARGGPGAAAPNSPREGSLGARILAWAGKRAKPFDADHVVKQFKVSRAHASMLLSRLASGAYPLRRNGRGVYEAT